MLVFGIILTIICIIILIIISSNTDDIDNVGASILITLSLVLGVVLIVGGSIEIRPDKKSLKENTLKIEVRSIFVNGKVTENDTVYIFTPKKK